MATYTGKKITADQIMNSKENLVPDNLTWNSKAPTLPDSADIMIFLFLEKLNLFEYVKKNIYK